MLCLFNNSFSGRMLRGDTLLGCNPRFLMEALDLKDMKVKYKEYVGEWFALLPIEESSEVYKELIL